ncbi:MAG: Flp family type IVb pilin [Elusimicrobiota bacterium]
MLKRFLNDESGQGMTEYILIIALIAVVCIAGIKVFGVQIRTLIEKSMKKIKTETEGFSE